MADTNKKDDKKAPSVADAKATAGVNAGSDEAGSLEDVEAAQEGKPTEEPTASFSSGFTVEAEAKAQRAIKEEAEKLAKLNAEREAAAKDDEKQATTALDRIKRLEARQDQLMAAVLALSDGRAVNTAALKETD